MKRLVIALCTLIALMIPNIGVGAASYLSIGSAAVDISEYYESMFETMGLEYRDPTLVLLDDDTSYSGACGTATTGWGAAFYCENDETIVLDTALLDAISDGDRENSGPISYDDDGLPFYVLAHEWGHHIEKLAGIINEAPQNDIELGADCFAGAWMKSAAEGGYYDTDDVADSILVASEIGGELGSSHGTGQQRAKAILSGYLGGIPACLVIDATVDDTPLPPEPVKDRPYEV